MATRRGRGQEAALGAAAGVARMNAAFARTPSRRRRCRRRPPALELGLF